MTTPTIDPITTFATGVVDIARANGAVAEVAAELPRVAETLSSNSELAGALADASVPAARRQQIIEDVLGGNVSPTTLGVISMLVVSGRAADLAEIASAVLSEHAGERGEQVAEVRSAVALTDDQISRLASALHDATGTKVLVRNIVDPTVVGGIVTQIGDSVLDGSVRTRLNQLREAF